MYKHYFLVHQAEFNDVARERDVSVSERSMRRGGVGENIFFVLLFIYFIAFWQTGDGAKSSVVCGH